MQDVLQQSKDFKDNSLGGNSGEFLVCCDCTDGCKTTACACRRLTHQDNTYMIGGKSVDKYGYQNGRLAQPIATFNKKLKNRPKMTGVLCECNKKCKCRRRPNNVKCENKPVQDGTRCRLQMFLTRQKGWGVRTLEDIAKGTFVAAYLGVIEPRFGSEGQIYKNFAKVDFIIDRYESYHNITDNGSNSRDTYSSDIYRQITFPCS